MHYRKMSKNYIFREFECGLTIEEAAFLCFKTVRTVKKWDEGHPIPEECKRLMRMHKRLELGHGEEWKGFRMNNNRLELPTGQSVTPQEILTGIALVEISAPDDIRTMAKLLKYVRSIAYIKNNR